MKRVLVIKLGALGDVALSMTPLRRIREAHPEAEITVLTTPAYADFFRASPYVDHVDAGGRPKGFAATAGLWRRLRRARYDRVYDLQTSDRSTTLFYVLGPKPPEWSGIAPGCSHPHRNPDRNRMHALEAKVDQLRDAGIWPDAPVGPGSAPSPDLSWVLANDLPERSPEHFGLTAPYALLVPGGSAHRPEKRWPVENYAALAALLRAEGYDVGVIGGPLERELAAAIPFAKDLTCKTDFLQIAGLGARAAAVVGNDTGPTHILAAAGAPTLTLFSADSDPALCAPRGARVEVLRRERLADLPVETVVSTLKTLQRPA